MNSKNKNFQLLYKKYKLIFFLFLIINIFLSINSGIYHIQLFEITENHLNNLFALINVYRFSIIYVIIFLSIFLVFYLKSKIDQESKFFLLYLAVQLICLFIYERDKAILDVHSPQIYDSIAYLFASMSSLLIFNLASHEIKKQFIKYFFFFVIFFFLIFSSFILTELYLETLGNMKNDYLYSSSTLKPAGNHFGQPNPRVTGLSRMILILFILSVTIIFYKKKLNRFYLSLLIFFSFICCFNIWALQSRGSILGLFLFSIIFLLFFKIQFLKKILILIFLFILPIITYEQVYKENLPKIREKFKDSIIVLNQKKNIETRDWVGIEAKERSLVPNIIKRNDKNSKVEFDESLNEYSSGRFQIWNNCFQILIQNKYWFGFGPQADRYLITKFLKNDLHASWGNNASNAFLYSLLSAGIFGMFFAIYIYFKSIKLLILNTFVIKDFFKSNQVLPICFFSILSFILLRSLFENSFLVFGIDFFLFIISYFYLKISLKT